MIHCSHFKMDEIGAHGPHSHCEGGRWQAEGAKGPVHGEAGVGCRIDCCRWPLQPGLGGSPWWSGVEVHPCFMREPPTPTALGLGL